MSTEDIDFIKGNALNTNNQQEQNLSLCYARPITNKNQETTVLTTDNRNPRKLSQETNLAEDGLYASDSPFIYSDIKFSQFSDTKIVEYESKNKFNGKLIEIVIRDANINTLTDETIEITSVCLLFKRKIICKANRPFNRKLHKLLIRNKEYSNLSIQVYIKGGQSSILPLPLPKRNIENSKVEIDFAISDNLGRIHAGTVICTVSVNNYGEHKQEPYTFQAYKLSNDPNDPQNNLSLFRLPKNISKKEVKYFLLEDQALMFDTDLDETFSKKTQTEEVKSPDIVVTEQPALSLLNTLFRNLFQIKQPLESSSGTRRHHTIGKTILAVTILRGIEIPIREESAFVQPFIEVEWGNTVHATSVAEGPAPVWQQTVQFELPRQNDEYCIKFRLYDLHPVWGQQWLGEARIPLELHRNYQELERWITLSPLFSPVLLFGYIQACPGQSCTRIYVLIKMEHPNTAKSIESTATNTLLKSIQRCLVTPYKINGLENPKDAARTVMFLPSLPTHYGPITPRQALNIRKVDHYGRASLLAVLLQSFDLQTYVLLGSSQISKVTAFVLSISSNGIYMLWDPETGNYHKLDDSHCPLMKVTRLINHFGMWENLQKSILPHNLKYDVKSSKEWRPIDIITSGKTDHNVQTIDVHITDEEVKHIKRTAMDIEQCLKDKLAYWRSTIGLTTIFNRHATAILRSFISQIEPFSEIQLGKKDLKQLYRAYHIHGFVLNKRECPVDELCKDLYATKIHDINGPVEFAVVSHVQPYIGKICSIWIAIIILRSHD